MAAKFYLLTQESMTNSLYLDFLEKFHGRHYLFNVIINSPWTGACNGYILNVQVLPVFPNHTLFWLQIYQNICKHGNVHVIFNGGGVRAFVLQSDRNSRDRISRGCFRAHYITINIWFSLNNHSNWNKNLFQCFLPCV